MPEPEPEPYDPCHLWQDAVDQGAAMLEAGVALIEGNLPQLTQCRLDNPGSGPQTIQQPLPQIQQQKGMRQISDSKVESETEDQRIVREALAVIRESLETIRRVTR